MTLPCAATFCSNIAMPIAGDARRRHHLLSLRVAPLAYEPFADRVCERRPTVTAHDGWYVALAETVDQLGTLDRRLSRSTGPRCRFVVPPA